MRRHLREREIGIRDLKSRLSECVRQVRTGATIVVTDQGRRVARLVPEPESLRDQIDTLRNAGSIQWSGRRLRRTKAVARLRGKRTVADILVENRE